MPTSEQINAGGVDARINADAGVDAGLIAQSGLGEVFRAPHFEFDVECIDGDILARTGERVVKWRDTFRNTVTTEGKNDLLTKYFKGSNYTAAWYVGLVSSVGWTGTAAGDTAAQINGTNAWKEAATANAPDYDEAVRQTLTLGSAAAGSINNTASKAVFTIAAGGTVKGAFICSVSTKDATTGVLYSAGVFSGGDRIVADNDILNISATLSAA